MSNLGKALFGGSESKSNTTTPTGFNSLPAQARQAYLDALSRGEELSLDESLFMQPELTGTQQSALSTLQGLSAPTSASQFQSGLETFYNPYEEQVVQNSINDILEQGRGLGSDIDQMASEAGGFGGTRQALLESELQSNILKNIGDVSASTRSAGFESAADRVLSDITRSQDAASQVFQLGDLERQIEATNTQAPLEAVNYLMQLAQGFPTGGGTVSTTRTDNYGQGMIAGLANLANMAGSAIQASDVRLKENIEYIGKDNGYNIYNYNYIKDPYTKYKGVMAQEVAETRPDAIVFDKGYMYVDYSRLGVNFEVLNG